MPSKGIALPVLLAQEAVFRNASPATKISARGYLSYLLQQNRPRILSTVIDDGSGYIRNVNIRAKKRLGLGHSVTTDDCSIQGQPAYFNTTIPSMLFRKYALFFDWKVMETFMEDALAMRRLPNSTPPTDVMQEVIDSFASVLNGLLGDIDTDLLNLQAVNFGKNIASGAATARTINFPLNLFQNNLSQGLTSLLSDAMANEISPNLGGMSIVGAGLINNVMLRQSFDPMKAPTMPQFYFDPLTQSRWGTDQFGIFDKDAVQFINICRFRGAKSGHFGTSNFGTLKWPIQDFLGNTAMGDFEFDFQAREVDCPSPTMIIGGASTGVGRGLVFDLMASYQQVNIGSDVYNTDDVLYGNNGSLRYVATNIDTSAPVTP